MIIHLQFGLATLITMFMAITIGDERISSSTSLSPPGQISPTPASSGDPHSGRSIYLVHCTSCHQLDGRGMKGRLAADFVGDKSRLAKSDAALLASIRQGYTGPTGAVMPGWGHQLTEKQMLDVLAYIRNRFGANN